MPNRGFPPLGFHPWDQVAIPDLEQLLSLPPTTLGHQYALHLRRQGLQPLRFGPRRVQVHDVVHVLTGYGTDLVGEAEVQGFILACHPLPINRLLTVGLLAKTQALGAMWRAYQRGKASTFDPDRFPLEQMWTVDIDHIRRTFRI